MYGQSLINIGNESVSNETDGKSVTKVKTGIKTNYAHKHYSKNFHKNLTF